MVFLGGEFASYPCDSNTAANLLYVDCPLSVMNSFRESMTSFPFCSWHLLLAATQPSLMRWAFYYFAVPFIEKLWRGYSAWNEVINSNQTNWCNSSVNASQLAFIVSSHFPAQNHIQCCLRVSKYNLNTVHRKSQVIERDAKLECVIERRDSFGSYLDMWTVIFIHAFIHSLIRSI